MRSFRLALLLAVFSVLNQGLAVEGSLLEDGLADAFLSCGTIYCYDSCLRQYVNVVGNQCGQQNMAYCYRAIGICNPNGPVPGPVVPNCSIKPCYDQCTGRYVFLRVNYCTSVLNVFKGCYQASGVCQ